MIICRYWLLWNVASSIKPNRHVFDAITHINKIAQLVEVEAFLAFLFDIYANCLNISCGWNCHRIECVLVTCGKRKRTALHKYIHVSVHKSCLKYRFKVIWCVHAVAMPFAHNTITPRTRKHFFCVGKLYAFTKLIRSERYNAPSHWVSVYFVFSGHPPDFVKSSNEWSAQRQGFI